MVGKILLKLLYCEVFVYEEVCVCIFYVAFGVVGIESDGAFVAAGSIAIVLLVDKHVAFENVNRRILILGVLAGFRHVLVDFFGIFHRVGVIVRACYGHGYFCILLCEVLCLLEVVGCCIGIAIEEFECADTYIVEGIVGID